MATLSFPIQLAPTTLTQPILPNFMDHFSLFSVQFGQSPAPEVEQAILDKVGTYGRQIGHLAEALEIVIEQLGLVDSDSGLPQAKKDILTAFLADVAAVRAIKHDAASGEPTPQG